MTQTTEPLADHHNALLQGQGRLHLRTELMRESLVSHDLQTRLDGKTHAEVSLLPWAKFINLGGSSVIDQGAKVLLPVLDMLIALRQEHPFIVSVGGGARMRHTLEIGLDLGLPVGGLAQIVGAVEEQNAHIVHALMSRFGGVSMCREHFTELPKYLLTGMTPIVISVPPYHFWEPPPKRGRLPENGSDLGAFITAEVLGVNQMIFVKDQDGQFDKNPIKHKNAKLLKTCTAKELLAYDDNDLILERSVLECLERARQVKQIYVVNGKDPEAIKRAFAGDNSGTIIAQSK